MTLRKLLLILVMFPICPLPLLSQDGFLVSVESPWWNYRSEDEYGTKKKIDALMLGKLKESFALHRFETAETIKLSSNRRLTDKLTFTVFLTPREGAIAELTVTLDWSRDGSKVRGDWPNQNLLDRPDGRSVPQRDVWETFLNPLLDRLVGLYVVHTRFKEALQEVAIARTARFQQSPTPAAFLSLPLTETGFRFFTGQKFEIFADPGPVAVPAQGTPERNRLDVCPPPGRRTREVSGMTPTLVLWRGPGGCHDPRVVYN